MRALILCLLLVSCGGGGSSVGQLQSAQFPLASEIVLDHAGQIVPFASTGRKPGQNTLTLRFQVVFEDFFKCVPDGHIGVMLRARLSAIQTAQYRGHGLIFGRFHNNSFSTRNLPDLQPIAVPETWSVGDEPPGFEPLLSVGVTPNLKDWTPLDVEVRSQQDPNRIGYTLSPTSVDLIDVNPSIDMAQEAIAFFDVADGKVTCPYAVRITNPTAVWS